MDFAEAQRYLLSFVNYEQKDTFAYNTRSWNLRAFRSFLDELGAPDRDLRIVHVAGTNGKGLTAAALSALLTAAGESVGLYTSPHLVTMRERIRLQGEMVGEDVFAAGVGRLEEVQRRLGHGVDGGYRTTFELLTALALLVFRETGCRWAVLETGLGGRLDATNVVQRPALCLLTSIARDHENVLGEGLTRIAGEKAGIMKSGVPALSVPQPEEAGAVLERRAAELGIELGVVGRDEDLDTDATGRVCWRGRPTALRGDCQPGNLSLALAAYARLGCEYQLPRDDSVIGNGLGGLRWPGRCELLDGSPAVLLDGGHNPAALEATLAEVRIIPGRRRICLFGASANKSLAVLCEMVSSVFDVVYPVAADNPRAADPGELAAHLPPEKTRLVQGGAVDLLGRLLDEADPDDLLAVLGSIFLVGEVKARAAELGLDGSLEVWRPPAGA